jgi:hypothetical protein
MTDAEVNVTRTAQIVYGAFKQLRNQLGGDYPHPYLKDEHHWQRVASVIIAQEMDPVRFVQSEFNRAGDKFIQRTRPTPRELAKQIRASVDNYHRFAPQTSAINYEEMFIAFKSRVAWAKKHLIPKWYANEEEILMDPGRCLDAWFRVIILPEVSENIVNRWLSMAKHEYQSDLGLRQFLEEIKDEYDISRIR